MVNHANTAGDYVSQFLHQVINGLPKLLGAVVILVIAYFVARVLSVAVRKLLFKANLNDHLHAGKGGNIVQRALPNPTGFIASTVYWVLFLFGVSLAVSALGIPVLADFIRAIYGYLPNVLAAFLIFLAAGAVSGLVATLLTNTMGETPTGKVLRTAVPVVVMGIASFMILNQLKIAPAIVTITYATLMGSAGLGMALAFGLGGRDVAARMLGGLYDKSQAAKQQVVADAEVGKANADVQTAELRQQV